MAQPWSSHLLEEAVKAGTVHEDVVAGANEEANGGAWDAGRVVIGRVERERPVSTRAGRRRSAATTRGRVDVQSKCESAGSGDPTGRNLTGSLHRNLA
jgi:2-oxoglutarate dehydrogenase complex dehydrogenase (E1) component-like enzyme